MRTAFLLVLVALVCVVVADRHHGGRYHYRNNELYRACHQDRVSKCPDLHPPFTHQSLHSCFHDHWDELSDNCRDVLQKVHKHHTQHQQQHEEPTIEDQDKPTKTLQVVNVDNHGAVLKDQDNMPVHPEPLHKPDTTTDEDNDVINNHELPDHEEEPKPHHEHNRKHHGKHHGKHGKHGKHHGKHGKHHGKEESSSASAEIALFWVIIVVGAIAAVALGLCCVCVSCCCCRRRNFRCKTAVAYVPIPVTVNANEGNTQSFGKIVHAGKDNKKDGRVALV